MSKEPAVHYRILRQAIFVQSLLFVEGLLGRKGNLIDLGAGHCEFSLMAQAIGWGVTALDVRKDRTPELKPDIRFIHADLLSKEWNPEDYDLILCLGVYYHLDQNMQHDLLARCRNKFMILDTHVANHKDEPNNYRPLLGDTYEKSGETGADYIEAIGLSDQKRKEKDLLASYDNKTSWWQTKDSLIETLHNYGWPHVWTFDHDDIRNFQRTFFVCCTIDQQKIDLAHASFNQFRAP